MRTKKKKEGKKILFGSIEAGFTEPNRIIHYTYSEARLTGPPIIHKFLFILISIKVIGVHSYKHLESMNETLSQETSSGFTRKVRILC